MIRDSGGRAVGYVQATVEGDHASIAYVVGREFQGRGHATAAARAMLAHLAADRGVREFAAVAEADNGPSIRLLERLGFAPAGRDAPGSALAPSERLYRRAAGGLQAPALPTVIPPQT